METSLTLENINGIIQAMDKIKPIDRSQFFNEYYNELVKRRSDSIWLKEHHETQQSAIYGAKYHTPEG
jgi:hypothetical protein